MKSFVDEIAKVKNDNDVIDAVESLISSNINKPNIYILSILNNSIQDLTLLISQYSKQKENYRLLTHERTLQTIKLKGKVKSLSVDLKHLSSKEAQVAYISETRKKQEQCQTLINLLTKGLDYLKTQVETRKAIIMAEETKIVQIDIETLGKYFKPQFKGMGNCYNYFDSLVEDLRPRRTAKEFAQIGLMIFESKHLTDRKPQTFSKWYDVFCKCVACEKKKYNPKDLRQPKEELRRLFNYL